MPDSWSGYKRARKTPASVRRGERISRVFITLGGYGTILAVVTIFGFLLAVVLPLLAGGEMDSTGTVQAFTGTPAAAGPRDPAVRIVLSDVDDQRLLAWTVDETGSLEIHRLVDGTLVERRMLFDGLRPTAWAFPPEGLVFLAGFADGSIRSGSIGAKSQFRAATDTEADWQPGGMRPTPLGAAFRTLEGQIREQIVHVELDPPQSLGSAAVSLLDVGGDRQKGLFIAGLLADGTLLSSRETVRVNMMTNQATRRLTKTEIPYKKWDTPPVALFLGGTGNNLYLVGGDGRAERYDVRIGEVPRLVDADLDFVPGPPSARMTAARWLIGKSTLVVGDDRGIVRAWFPTKRQDTRAADETTLSLGHQLEAGPGAVTALAGSRRGRVLVVGHAGGAVRAHQVTTEVLLGTGQMAAGEELISLALAPKEDEIVAFHASGARRFAFDAGHAEASLSALFTPVWYEGASGPAHVWQSTGGSDDFEPKMGLWVLVFGTLKATLYCMMIAAPIALLAAIYSSEFLSARTRAPIKSVVEMMAGLPSVVLGFIGGMVLAPFVQEGLAGVLLCFYTIPLALVLGARLWQFFPSDVAIRLEGLPRVAAILAMIGVGVLLGTSLGPVLEHHAFDGNLEEWLGGVGTEGALAAWALMLFPLSVVVVSILVMRTAWPAIQAATQTWSRTKCAALDLARLLAVVQTGILLAIGLASLLVMFGFDPRGGFIGGYSQKNSLVVGFVMGFAVIPIIYTLADDALSSVPRALREGSLGAGATPWQTAWRITVPTAMSGLFSAMMVGLGRAVGETMIVLMATGNTPITEWNVFAGLRTLAANLAVELPEAPKDGTHYRVLFLSAFVLFLMTFVINTLAETVRRTFRKRAAQL